jgi:penicillin-insensitive murein endopeptidase
VLRHRRQWPHRRYCKASNKWSKLWCLQFACSCCRSNACAFGGCGDNHQCLFRTEAQHPSKTYVYGETGWPSGGSFRPHRTHQNGLSVDFFVPVRNGDGKSVPLPTAITNRFGYDIEFGTDAKYGEYEIDFPAMAEHLYQLHAAAKARGTDIALVIFDSAFLPLLFATQRGSYLQQNLPFMKGKPWVRHDEHFHVDFAMPCKPITG